MRDLSLDPIGENGKPGKPAAPDAADAGRLSSAASIAPEGAQLAMAWDDNGQSVTMADAPDAKTRAYRGARGDWRRTVDYLAARGPLPLVQMHGIASMKPERAVARIVKLTGETRGAALDRWERMNREMLAYTAPRLGAMEMEAGAALALGLGAGAGAAHFLAARAAGVALRNNAGTGLRDNQALSRGEIGQPNQRVIDHDSGDIPVSEMPPKGKD